jgi:hypothetical protein
MVKIFVYSYNPQITKARVSSIYKSNIIKFNGLSMLVGISEAIRLLFLNYFCPFLYLTLHPLTLSPTKKCGVSAGWVCEKHIYLRYIKDPLKKLNRLVNKRYYSNISIKNSNNGKNTFNQ